MLEREVQALIILWMIYRSFTACTGVCDSSYALCGAPLIVEGAWKLCRILGEGRDDLYLTATLNLIYYKTSLQCSRFAFLLEIMKSFILNNSWIAHNFLLYCVFIVNLPIRKTHAFLRPHLIKLERGIFPGKLIIEIHELLHISWTGSGITVKLFWSALLLYFALFGSFKPIFKSRPCMHYCNLDRWFTYHCIEPA